MKKTSSKSPRPEHLRQGTVQFRKPQNRQTHRTASQNNSRSGAGSTGNPLPRNSRPTGNPRKRNSRRYRQRQLRLRITVSAGIFLVLLLLIFLVRGCTDKKGKPANADVSVQSEDKSSGSKKDGSDPASDQKTDGQKEAQPTPMEPVSLTVSVVGDCTLGTDEGFDYSTSLNAYYESNGPDYFMANVRDIFSSDDLTIANFEGTLTDSEYREDKQFAFKAPAEYAQILTSGSIEAVTTANNHSHDYGEESFTDTLSALDAEGVTHFGYDETAVVNIKGIKVGLVGIYELNDHLERTQQLKQNIRKVKDEGAQITIVIFHWGNEKEEVPDSNQTTLGRLAIDEGADLVCGHHPHVLQGIEEYKGKNIVYSLGNFCFGGNSYPSDMDSMIFQQTFTVDENGVKADNATNIIPCSISSAYDYNNYQPTPAEGEEADRILYKIQERSSWITPAESASAPEDSASQ